MESKRRDQKRINRITQKINLIWNKNPDLRLCQLINNIATPVYDNDDLFYLEDNIFETALDNYLEKLLKKESSDGKPIKKKKT